MLPSMRFYIISIVSIFIALGIGIFIGFTIDTQDFITEQKNIISEIVESQFETLITENKELKSNEEKLEFEIKYRDEYIDASYEYLIKDRLKGLNIGIIGTNEDYVTSGIGRDLELAGAKVTNVTTLNNIMINREDLNNLYKSLELNMPKNPVESTVTIITESIVNGKRNDILDDLERRGFIETIGNYEESVDYLIICGGSLTESSKRINQLDRHIVLTVKEHDIPILGVEKSNVNYSYISGYKDLGISTVDNVDMTIGKVAMILAIEGMGGNYGIKDTSESIIPHLYNSIQ
ncbi:copper transporter [Tissierella sp. MB52-C2]|uniref:copper transporter n=1 Tax=Tissierella sp. MB52-C2 TaxID=3070999 RepID=UPI00280B284E|nr:copper transporter [Tissierella sp. MB52-C2]WMM26475.1 copper transporter [Tissierella sp. MB52-C2]